MAEPQDMILPLLRELRAEMRAGFFEIGQRFAAMNARFDSLERHCDGLQDALNGKSVRGGYTASRFEERLSAIEGRVTILETSHQNGLTADSFDTRPTPSSRAQRSDPGQRDIGYRGAAGLLRSARKDGFVSEPTPGDA